MDNDKRKLICDGLIYGRGKINERKKDYDNTPLDYDHIPEVLWYHQIDKIQAKNLLLEMQGHYSIEIINKIIQPIIRFLDQWEPENEGNLIIETRKLTYLFDKFIKEASNITIDIEYSKVSAPIRLGNFNTEYLEPTCQQYNKFFKALKRELKSTLNKEKILLDLQNELFPAIEKYTTWYVKNQETLNKSKISRPYKLMLELFVRVFKDILQYFPEQIKIFDLNENTQKKQKSCYFLNVEIIAKLYKIFKEHELIGEKVEYVDFIQHFDLNNKPSKQVEFKHKNMLIFTLKNIEKINNTIALTHFNIKYYNSYKDRAISTKWLSAQNKIEELFEIKPIIVRSK